MDPLRPERRPGISHSGGLKSEGVGDRGVGSDGHGGWAEVYGRVEEKKRLMQLDIARRRERQRDSGESCYRTPKRRTCQANPNLPS